MAPISNVRCARQKIQKESFPFSPEGVLKNPHKLAEAQNLPEQVRQRERSVLEFLLTQILISLGGGREIMNADFSKHIQKASSFCSSL
jgi:hypothetical protein